MQWRCFMILRASLPDVAVMRQAGMVKKNSIHFYNLLQRSLVFLSVPIAIGISALVVIFGSMPLSTIIQIPSVGFPAQMPFSDLF